MMKDKKEYDPLQFNLIMWRSDVYRVYEAVAGDMESLSSHNPKPA